jgi:hypothetical protein
MSPRLKAYLIGVGLLAVAAVFGVRAAWKYQKQDSTVGAVLSGIVCAGFLYGGVQYLITGRPDTPQPTEQTTEPPPGGSP